MERNRSVRAALMISAAVTMSAPALAQQVPPTPGPAAGQVVPVTPPPVASTAAPQTSTPSSPASGNSATPINPEAAAQAAAEDEERAAERRASRRAAPPREAAAAPAVRAAARTEAPAARPQPTASGTPSPTAAAPAAPGETSPTAAEPARRASAPAVAQPAQEGGAPVWPLAVIAALIVAAGAFFFLRRRKADEAEDQWGEPAPAEYVAAGPAAVEPGPVRAAPAAMAAAPLVTPRHDPVPDAPVVPVAAEEASVAPADSDDVAALTAAKSPGDRPWLEFAMRPVRAGTNVDEALVEIELTVGNAGPVAAEDVRIATFMLSADDATEMERLLIDPREDAAVSPMTIAAGEGTRVDATLAMNRAALGTGAFRPVIVADARYRLPDGSEGRTSASFLVGGATGGGAPEPIALDRILMRDDVEAQLYRQPERV